MHKFPIRLTAIAALCALPVSLVIPAANAATTRPASVTNPPERADTAGASGVTAGASGVTAGASGVTGADRMTARVAAGWLGRQMVDGDHLATAFGGATYPDPGLTLDAVLAFSAAKVNNVRAERALTWLAAGQVASYIGDGTNESYAGAHAKLALALSVRGKKPNAFAGRDIVGELAALARANGRLSDRSQWGDFSNAFSQSLGIIALKRAGKPVTKAAAYLAGQACADGGVPIILEGATCQADLDATSLAAQAFRASGRSTDAGRALTWLRTYEAKTASFGNANSAGLGAAALASAGRPDAAAKARRFLTSLQQGCAVAFGSRGALAFEPGIFDRAAAPRATAQGVLGLTGTDLVTVTSAGSIDWAPTLAC